MVFDMFPPRRALAAERRGDLRRHGDAVAAEFCEPAQLALREMRLAVPARRVRRDLGLHEAAHGVLHRAMVVVEDHGAVQPSFGTRSSSVPVPSMSSVSPAATCVPSSRRTLRQR